MTTENEKQFYEWAEIEPYIQDDYCYWECKDAKKQFKPCKKKSCEKCPKFSHCNNNNLFCISLIEQFEKAVG